MHPKQLQRLIKECVIEVLQEDLLETFDPTSQGPNVTQENPYPAWNAKMRTMEETNLHGNHTVDFELMKKALQKSQFDINRAIELIRVHGNHSPRAEMTIDYLKKMTPKEVISLFSSIREDGNNHFHGRYAQQAGAMSFDAPHDTSIVEDANSTAFRVKKQLYTLLANNGFRRLGEQPRDYMEFYLGGFATVGCSVLLDENKVFLERYYDSERLDTTPGYHIEQKISIPETYQEDFVRKILLACLRMKRSIEGNESIMGGSDEDLQEGSGVNETLELTPAGEDDWSRPIYQDQHGNIYVDINLGKGKPSIHTVTDQGEPETPVHNFKIVGQGKGREFPNALCPRCKNSKPELMTNHPDGTKTCNFCHWSNSPH